MAKTYKRKRPLNMHPVAVRRRKFGWTQQKLAERVGILQPHIARIELGSVPKMELAKKIASVLKIKIDKLF